MPVRLEGSWSQARLCLEAHLDDEEEVTKFCMGIGLIKPSYNCSTHRQQCTLRYRTDRSYAYWYCRKCDKSHSATNGSVFEGSKLPLSRALMLMFCFARTQSYDDTQNACILSSEEPMVSSETIAEWFRRFRELIVDSVDSITPEQGQIGGRGMIVQIDEAVIGRRKYHRGRMIPEQWVVGMIDEAGNVRMEQCSQRDKPNLHGLILKYVKFGSIIHTDGWKGYCGIEKHGYEHKTVNHSIEFVAPDGTHTQRIESQWRALRRGFTPGGKRRPDLGINLIEYMWKRAVKQRSEDPFVSIVKLMQI